MRLQATAGPPEEPRFEEYVFLDRLDELTERAHAGDLDAMRELGDGLHNCLTHLRDPDAKKLRDTLAMQLDHGRAEKGAHLDQQAYARHDRAMREHANCLAIGAERAGTGLAWLERAARAGHLQAQLGFVRRALDASSYPEREDLYANLDEVIRRRELVDRWIVEAIATGERSALADIANSDGAVRDPRQQSLYELAWRHVLVRDFGDDSPHADDMRRAMDRDTYLAIGQDWAREDAAWNDFLEQARTIAERTSPLPPEYARRPPPPSGG